MKMTARKIYEFDATGQTVGRLATQISRLLQGKHKASYLPNVDSGDTVHILNIRNLRFSGKKIDQKVYYRHSGYLGGLKTTPIRAVMATKPDEVLRKAVKQMLPKNRLQNERLKRLIIK